MNISDGLRRAQQLQKRLNDIDTRLTTNAFSERFNGLDEIKPEETFEKTFQDIKDEILTLREYREMIAFANSNVKLSNGMSLVGGILYLGYLKNLLNSLTKILQTPKQSFQATGYGSDMVRIKTKEADNDFIKDKLSEISDEIDKISSEIDKLNIETEL